MPAVDEVRSLLAPAFEDAAASRVLISSRGVHPATTPFHAQQAVEKAIKAVLVLH
jgi:HEPN domain-containing protein